MPKLKTTYVCSNCGASSAKWIGRCPSCGEWNTYNEEVLQPEPTRSASAVGRSAMGSAPILIKDIVENRQQRSSTQSSEFDRVLGGGLVPGVVVLFGGEPGIGKSTLLLQVAGKFKGTVLYASGEESAEQIKMRATRLKVNDEKIYFLAEISCENIIAQARNLKPDLLIVDSIQTLRTEYIDSSSGTVSQIRESASLLQQYAKETATPVIIVGHITKDGSLAGPKVLEHVVDTVLQFEGDNHFFYRILRAHKNRFGSTSEIGIFEMGEEGLAEVPNPSEFLLSNHRDQYSGISTAATLEGVRPFMVEVQALVSSAVYGTPQRSSTGFDTRRLNMLLAVLEKKVGFKLATKDVFLNLAGGLKVVDPALDLAVISAILSSDIDRPLRQGDCFAGEVGLSGEIRPTARIEQRIAEAAKLGYKRIFVPNQPKGLQPDKYKIEILFVDRLEQVISQTFK
ncbi:MAG: DNA repair protein RadA [Salinivirgaceae bacterium]|nr:DNA repair protein RadA [Salinivirgaceae bacterium]